MLPPDVDPESRCRLPLVRREDLDDAGREIFDFNTTASDGNLRGLTGPGGVRLHSPRLAAALKPVGRYLRFESGHSARVREVAILVVAREFDSRFEWAAHEPEAIRVGVPQETVDAIKYRRPVDGLDDTDAIVVQLGRETFRDHRVTSPTYARAAAAFGAAGLVDLVALMGHYASTAALLTVVDMQLDDDETHLLPEV